MEPVSDVGVQHIESSDRYTAQEVADAFVDTLGRNIVVQEIPRDELEEAFAQYGFSEKAATSCVYVIRRLIDRKADTTDEPRVSCAFLCPLWAYSSHSKISPD